jgi:hypothetical protein
MNDNDKLMLQEYSAGIVLDTALTQYSALWDRLGNMQQSASILVTVLTLLFTVQFTLFTTNITLEDKNFHLISNKILFLLLLSSIYNSIYSLICIYNVLLPKIATHLRPPSLIQTALWETVKKKYEDLNSFEYAKISANTELNLQISKAIEKIDEILTRNKLNYKRSINFAILAFIWILILFTCYSILILSVSIFAESIYTCLLSFIILVNILSSTLILNKKVNLND